ncbi:hypothetical protein A3F08_01330 [Candidatus Berkelbacteria bacterium RIFCSPHIGHO2_12_FULL_36_9]|uniref:Uncharacterized protein n=1 Tax=Candidatus Berkelbacteria bacterium RIFCSPHIGHO2_12_FULL_36_9 TaxID=1797469 RepID=A0A1F5EF71_9BACT|nr:MAG: hypothetical protein A3F08_01330 [Candidatus Berkelbacteria bacterium RIFCSPHIGHO2_12_FULL_36_9]
MSKKKKFKKFFKAQILSEMNKVTIEEQKRDDVIDTELKLVPETSRHINESENTLVKKDLQKVIIVFLFIVLVLAALAVLNNKSIFLTQLSQVLIKILHLN